MRRFVPIIPCLVMSVLACGAEAAAQKPSARLPLLPMADWHVAPVMAENAALPDYCALVARYQNGPIVTFTRNAQNVGSIIVDIPNARLESGRQYAITARIQKKTTRFAARAIGPTRLVLQGAETSSIFDAHGLGHPLTISLDGTAGIFKLSGNVSAFFQFDHCMRALDPSAEPTIDDTHAKAVQNPPVDIVPLDDMGHEISWEDAHKTADSDTATEHDRTEMAAAEAMPDDVKNRLKSTLSAARAKAAPQTTPVEMVEHTQPPKAVMPSPVSALPQPAKPLHVSSDATDFDALNKLGATAVPVMPAPTPKATPKPTVPAKKPVAMTAPPAMPVPADPVAAPVPSPVPAPVPAKIVSTKPTWAQRTQAFLFAHGLSSSTNDASAQSITWHEADGVMATARLDDSNDIVEVATNALDQAEGACRGAFTSQMGLPETFGQNTMQLLESKCVDATGKARITTWLINHSGKDTTVWHFHSAGNARAETFALRDAVYKALMETNS